MRHIVRRALTVAGLLAGPIVLHELKHRAVFLPTGRFLVGRPSRTWESSCPRSPLPSRAGPAGWRERSWRERRSCPLVA